MILDVAQRRCGFFRRYGEYPAGIAADGADLPRRGFNNEVQLFLTV